VNSEKHSLGLELVPADADKLDSCLNAKTGLPPIHSWPKLDDPTPTRTAFIFGVSNVRVELILAQKSSTAIAINRHPGSY
jgi:hypothetical protein